MLKRYDVQPDALELFAPKGWESSLHSAKTNLSPGHELQNRQLKDMFTHPDDKINRFSFVVFPATIFARSFGLVHPQPVPMNMPGKPGSRAS